MNNFSKAHQLTKQVIQAGDNYAATFSLCLKHIIQTAKENAMNYVQHVIETFEKRIAELEAFKATKPAGYIIVTGSKMPMPIKFSEDFKTVGATNVENATRFDRLDIARVKGATIRNGAGEVGRVVHITIQIEHDLTDTRQAIADLKKS